MELDDALLFVGGFVLMVALAIYLADRVTPKFKLIYTIVLTSIMNAMFIINLFEKFSWVLFFLEIAFFISCVYSISKKYKEYKAYQVLSNHDSGS